MKILITGARGMMGRDLSRLAEESGRDVWPTDVERLDHDADDRIDVTDFADVARAVEHFGQDLVHPIRRPLLLELALHIGDHAAGDVVEQDLGVDDVGRALDSRYWHLCATRRNIGFGTRSV